MYRVALNTAIAWTRKEDRHQRGKQPLEVVEGLLTTASAAPDPRVELGVNGNVRRAQRPRRAIRYTLCCFGRAALPARNRAIWRIAQPPVCPRHGIS